MYKYILFDWDGTLAKTLDLWLNAYKETFVSEGLTPTDEEITSKAFGQREKGMANIGSSNPTDSWNKVVENVNSRIKDVELYSSALDVLTEFINKGLKMALLTQSDKVTVMPAVENKNLSKYFEVILTKDDVTNKKPDPEIFLKGLENLGGTKEEAIIIGDSYHDILGGKNAGIATVAFYPKENEKFYSREELEKENPDYFVTDLKELLKIIL